MRFYLLTVLFVALASSGVNSKLFEDPIEIDRLRNSADLQAIMRSQLHNNWESNMKTLIDKINSDSKWSTIARADESEFADNFHVGSSSFQCSTDSSSSVPTSVHKLRPSDIKVISAIGDSLTAGNGILAKTILGLLIQYRGTSFTIGGEHNIQKQVTLPNILKLFNSNLKGYSTGFGSVNHLKSKLNFAEPGKKAQNMPQQARDLVKAMQSSSSGIDFKNDWKIINIFIGGNDICDFCKDKKIHSIDSYKKNVREALDILHKNVPRAFVNIIELLDVSIIEELSKMSPTCSLLVGGFLCQCAARPSNSAARQQIVDTISGYQAAARELASSGRYDTRSDFTVVSQPFFRNTQPPRKNGKYDLKFFAPDCFHFSAKGHAGAAKALWNNMLEPVGNKTTSWSPDGPFLCPTKKRPYFATSKN